MADPDDYIFSLHFSTVSKTELTRVVKVDGFCDRCGKEFVIRSPKDAEEYLRGLAIHINTCGTFSRHPDHTVAFEEAKQVDTVKDLNWTEVGEAALHITKLVNDAAYIPPESIDKHLKLVDNVCRDLDRIVAALKIRQK